MTPDVAERYADRRARVVEALGEEAAMILPAAPEVRVGRDLEIRYRPDPDLHYLTGYPEPGAVAVLSPSCEEGPFILFVRPRDARAEQWAGPRGGTEAAREIFGADAAYPITELPDRLPKLVAGADRLFFRLGGGQDEIERIIRDIVIAGRKRRQRHGRGPRALVDPGAILDDMRLIKDDHEIDLLRRAARITIEAFREAARSIHPGAEEREVEAALEAGFRRRGADGAAFGTIVASGANATVLHYTDNARAMTEGDLVLLDAGASYCRYAGDVSRTFPVSGRFRGEQRDLYEAVRVAKDAAIDHVRPGATLDGAHRAAARVLVSALVDLGLLDGDVDALVDDRDAYRTFFPHRTSHWLGMEVHDVGDYARHGRPRRFEPGMVLTVEPGLYIPPDHDRAPEGIRGAGIRIEDDVLVTREGRDVLTAGLPSDAEGVASMAGRTEPW